MHAGALAFSAYFDRSDHESFIAAGAVLPDNAVVFSFHGKFPDHLPGI